MAKKKVTSSMPSPAPDQPEDPVRVYEQAMRKVQLAHRWRAADGRSAWSELNRMAYGDDKGRDPRKLNLEDRTILARRLHDFLEEVAPRLQEQGISRGELCRRAGLCGRRQIDEKLPDDAKELYRLTLPPATDARKRGIRSGAERYLRLIEVLAAELDHLSVHRVADRLLRDTSLHPLSKTKQEWSDLEKVQSYLQRIVDELDQEFDLFNLYRRTAELKCRGITEGSTLCWPLWDLDDHVTSASSPEEIDSFRAERAVAADLSQAYYRRHQYFGRQRHEGEWWLYGFETNALQDDAFFFVPHAYLGAVVMWDLPDRRADPTGYDLKRKEEVQYTRSNPYWVSTPKDDWDSEKSCPTGQTELPYHFWLLAYPHPDGRRLVPTLYMSGEEGGAYLLPLDMGGMDMLSDAVWVSMTDDCPVVDRLEALLLDRGQDGLNPIQRNMQRTAGWLAQNPILRRKREREERSRRLDEVFRAER